MPRDLCDRCNRPFVVCYCLYLPNNTLLSTTQLIILQHIHEKKYRKAISSVPVVRNVLANVQLLVVGTGKDDRPETINEISRLLFDFSDISKYHEVLLLYPHPDAKDLKILSDQIRSNIDSTTTPSIALIVIDGTWIEAKKIMYHYQHVFQQIEAKQVMQSRKFRYVSLQLSTNSEECTPSIYGQLRPEPKNGYVSTLEAIAHALQILEPNVSDINIPESLLKAFHGMVHQQSVYITSGKDEKLKLYNGIPKSERRYNK